MHRDISSPPFFLPSLGYSCPISLVSACMTTNTFMSLAKCLLQTLLSNLKLVPNLDFVSVRCTYGHKSLVHHAHIYPLPINTYPLLYYSYCGTHHGIIASCPTVPIVFVARQGNSSFGNEMLMKYQTPSTKETAQKLVWSSMP